jgi:hypothetical protein
MTTDHRSIISNDLITVVQRSLFTFQKSTYHSMLFLRVYSNSSTDNSSTDNSSTDNSLTDYSWTDNSSTDNSLIDNSSTNNSSTDSSSTIYSLTDNWLTDNWSTPIIDWPFITSTYFFVKFRQFRCNFKFRNSGPDFFTSGLFLRLKLGLPVGLARPAAGRGLGDEIGPNSRWWDKVVITPG